MTDRWMTETYRIGNFTCQHLRTILLLFAVVLRAAGNNCTRHTGCAAPENMLCSCVFLGKGPRSLTSWAIKLYELDTRVLEHEPYPCFRPFLALDLSVEGFNVRSATFSFHSSEDPLALQKHVVN